MNEQLDVPWCVEPDRGRISAQVSFANLKIKEG